MLLCKTCKWWLMRWATVLNWRTWAHIIHYLLQWFAGIATANLELVLHSIGSQTLVSRDRMTPFLKLVTKQVNHLSYSSGAALACRNQYVGPWLWLWTRWILKDLRKSKEMRKMQLQSWKKRKCLYFQWAPSLRRASSRSRPEPVTCSLRCKYTDPRSKYIDPWSKYTNVRSKYTDPRSKHTDPKSKYTDPRSKYTDPRSRYTDPRSKYTDPRSKYTDVWSKYMDPRSKSMSFPPRRRRGPSWSGGSRASLRRAC